MRNRATILFFVGFLLAGYSCQLGRFQTPVQQYYSTLPGKKKTLGSLRSGNDNKQSFTKKTAKEKTKKNTFTFLASSVSPEYLFDNPCVFYFDHHCVSSSMAPHGERGPPLLI